MPKFNRRIIWFFIAACMLKQNICKKSKGRLHNVSKSTKLVRLCARVMAPRPVPKCLGVT